MSHAHTPMADERLQPLDIPADTGHAAADRLISRLTSADPDFQDCTDAAQLLRHLAGLVNSPEVGNFLRGTHLEAVHQVDRWGTAHDRAKRPADWFWLVGYLAGKALHAATTGDQDKARHHCISTAAALYNWHCAIQGLDVRMCPGSSDVAQIVDAAFPGEGNAHA